MLTTKTFKPSRSGKVHVLHETNTTRCFGFLVALCGKQFPCKAVGTTRATCPSCLRLDNPFALSNAQYIKVTRLALHMSVTKVDDLYKRDVVNPVTGALTPRGVVLFKDLMSHPPWPGIDGVIHSRNVVAYKRAVCGADLVGVDDMSYAKLARLLALAGESKVTCMECIVET